MIDRASLKQMVDGKGSDRVMDDRWIGYPFYQSHPLTRYLVTLSSSSTHIGRSSRQLKRVSLIKAPAELVRSFTEKVINVAVHLVIELCLLSTGRAVSHLIESAVHVR